MLEHVHMRLDNDATGW